MLLVIHAHGCQYLILVNVRLFNALLERHKMANILKVGGGAKKDYTFYGNESYITGRTWTFTGKCHVKITVVKTESTTATLTVKKDNIVVATQGLSTNVTYTYEYDFANGGSNSIGINRNYLTGTVTITVTYL